MKIENIEIQRFRSIEKCELSQCGGFNVLIGKNNSGKSNILSAIELFFSCIDDQVVTLSPKFGETQDFFKLDTKSPIEIKMVFALEDSERNTLMKDIVTEAQQLKNVVDGIDPSLKLSITVNIIKPNNAFAFPEHFGFIKKLALGDSSSISRGIGERLIFGMSADSANELYDSLSDAVLLERRIGKMIEFLEDMKRIGSRWFKAEPVDRHILLERYINDTALINILEIPLMESSSVEEFQSAIGESIAKIRKEVQALKDLPLKKQVRTFAGEQPIIPTYVKNLLKRLADLRFLHLKERRKPIGKEEASRLLSLKVTRGGPQVLQGIQETVNALLGVQIDAFASDVRTRNRESNAELDIDNFLIDVNGSGIREALRIILDFELEHPNILLIEEPEIYLHPALETSLMRYLKRISHICQVFIATHSTNFIDTGEMKNIYFASKNDSTQLQLLNYDEAEVQIPKELGIRLSSLFMFDRLIFVEGPSDEAVLREWASIMKVNLSQYNVGFVHLGGVRNFTHYATDATLSFLAKRQVQLRFIIDRDEKDEEEISRLQAMVSDNARVNVLGKRELENYLISPRPLKNFIALKKQLRGIRDESTFPTEAEVIAKVEEVADELKSFSTEKLVAKELLKPLYPNLNQVFQENLTLPFSERVENELRQLIEKMNELQGRAVETYEQKVKEIDERWERSKLDLVPGDILIAKVCESFDVRFKKEKDSARLAKLMNEHEIAIEIQQIVREIVQ